MARNLPLQVHQFYTITRSMARYFPVRFGPCLLAYLIVSGVAIILAQPNYVRIFGKDIPTAPEVAESSSRVREVTNQNQGPSLREEDKTILRLIKYTGNQAIAPTAEEYHRKFRTESGSKQFQCCKSSERIMCDDLPLLVTAPADADFNLYGQVVRLMYDPPKDSRNIVTAAKLAQLFRKLIHYVDRLHTNILKRYSATLPQATKDTRDKELFEWIYQQILGKLPDHLPLVGVIKNEFGMSWKAILDSFPPTETQKILASYFTETGPEDTTEETTYKVVENYLAEHRGESNRDFIS
ncbi:hypothetical protein PCASD_04361 [Puccinia coronata f. sp. avenae]|uniref:Uncharacterized protein n=1 Tax=Puccinia coronata f. sp. avenae TaxID=200324 RepID=A0A2N5VCU7_9BASI|nr:hypothetical protein PCASD_04361 [Puccinia coronata f. sp. avenae]